MKFRTSIILIQLTIIKWSFSSYAPSSISQNECSIMVLDRYINYNISTINPPRAYTWAFQRPPSQDFVDGPDGQCLSERERVDGCSSRTGKRSRTRSQCNERERELSQFQRPVSEWVIFYFHPVSWWRPWRESVFLFHPSQVQLPAKSQLGHRNLNSNVHQSYNVFNSNYRNRRECQWSQSRLGLRCPLQCNHKLLVDIVNWTHS